SMQTDQRQLNEARLPGSVVHSLDRFSVISGLGPEDIRNERLWVPVIQREPARLHLHHHAMTRKEDVVRGRQRKAIQQRLVGFDRFGPLQTLAITSTKDVRRDHQLITAQLRLARYLIGINIDELDDPIGVSTASRSN